MKGDGEVNIVLERLVHSLPKPRLARFLVGLFLPRFLEKVDVVVGVDDMGQAEHVV
jgi:hypothetical protein